MQFPTAVMYKMYVHCVCSFDNIDELPDEIAEQPAVQRINLMPVEQLIAESGKMVFLVQLLDNIKAEGHRALVFSMHRRVLNIIERIMQDRVRASIICALHYMHYTYLLGQC